MNTITKFDSKSLAVALKAITKSAVKTRNMIQDVAQYAVAVSITSGDVSVANLLLEALGGTKSLRKDSLVAYCEKLGNFAWLKQDKKFGFLLNTRTGCTDGTLTPEWESMIVGSKWDEAKKEAEIVSEYDMEKQFRIFIARMEKLALEPANTITNGEILQAVRNTYNRIVAEKTLKSMTVDQSVLDATAAQQAAFDAKQAAAVEVPAQVQAAA
jgi:hypothetical protein